MAFEGFENLGIPKGQALTNLSMDVASTAASDTGGAMGIVEKLMDGKGKNKATNGCNSLYT